MSIVDDKTIQAMAEQVVAAHGRRPASHHPRPVTDGEGEVRRVSWFMCNCQVISKYCDENHRASARIPLDVLERYQEGEQ